MGKLTCLWDHNVVVVSVTYPENKRRHTVAGTGVNKPLHCCLKLMRLCVNASRSPSTESSRVDYNAFQKDSVLGTTSDSKKVESSLISFFYQGGANCHNVLLVLSQPDTWTWGRLKKQKATVICSKFPSSPCPQLYKTIEISASMLCLWPVKWMDGFTSLHV